MSTTEIAGLLVKSTAFSECFQNECDIADMKLEECKLSVQVWYSTNISAISHSCSLIIQYRVMDMKENVSYRCTHIPSRVHLSHANEQLRTSFTGLW